MTRSTAMIMAFVVYTVAVVLVGIWKGRRATAAGEVYFLAKRQIPGWLAAFSAAAAGESAWVMLGLVGTGYTDGVSCFWLIPGCILGYAFNALYLGPALRNMRRITVPETIGAGTAEGSTGYVRRTAALIVVVFLGAYVAAQFTAAAKAFEAFLGVSYLHGVILGAAIIISYTILGGQNSVAWTHLIQASMMVAALLVVPVVALIMAGGPGEVILALRAADPLLLSAWHGNALWAGVGLVLGWSGIGLGYPGQPHVLMQYMSGRSPGDVRRNWIISTLWATCAFTGAITAGLIARAWLGAEIASDPEQGLPALAARVFPAWVQGLVLAAIIASTSSTADSQLLAVTAALGLDLPNAKSGVKLGEWRRRISSRVLLVVAGLGALLMAATENRLVFSFVLFAWGVLGAGLGPILICIARGRMFTPKRAVFVMVAGASIAVAWRAYPPLKGTLYELVPAFAIGLVLAWTMSRRNRAEELGREQEEMRIDVGSRT